MIRLKIHGRNTLKRIHKYREHCFLISSPKYRKVKCPSSIKSSEGVVQGFLYLQRLKSYKKGTVALNFCRMQTVPSQNVYVIEDSPISECPPREEKWGISGKIWCMSLGSRCKYIKSDDRKLKKKMLEDSYWASGTFAVDKSHIRDISHCPRRQKREWPDNQPFHRNFAKECWLPPG